MDELKPCPFCGKSELHTNREGHVRCVNDECFQNQFIAEYAWQTRPLEDALQQRVEELETSIKEAVKEITGLSIYDIPEQGQEDDAKYEMKYKIIDILRKHGLVEDK